MAPKRRQRAIITGNVNYNGVQAAGQVVILLGKCNMSGELKTPSGKAIRKGDAKYYKVRFEDKSWINSNNLHSFYETTVSDSIFQRFFKKVTN